MRDSGERSSHFERGTLKYLREPVHSLEQQETGELRRLSCALCGRRFFASPKELDLHKMLCDQVEEAASTGYKQP